MRDQTIVWTPCPNGFTSDGTSLRLSVHVAPRLRTDAANPTLALFPDFVDWPATLAFGTAQSATFAVQIGTAAAVPATIDTSRGVPTSSVWKALLASTLGVTPWTFDDLSQRAVRSYPVSLVYSWLRDIYTATVAANPSTYPSSQSLGSTLAPLDPSQLGPAQRQLALLGSSSAPPSSRYSVTNPTTYSASATQTTQNFAQLATFYGRQTLQPDIDAKGNLNPWKPTIPPFDFHQAVAALGEHADLLRQLGLVVDLIVPYSGGTRSTTSVRISPTYHGSFPHMGQGTAATGDGAYDVRPLVTAGITSPGSSSPGSFTALSASGTIAGGYLTFDDGTHFAPIEVDVDGAAIKALQLKTTLNTQQAAAAPDTPTTTPLSSLRTGGVSVTRLNAAPTLQQRLAAAHNAQAAAVAARASANSTDPTFSADDLLRGVRVDVADLGPVNDAHQPQGPTVAYRSLHRRNITFTLTATGQTVNFNDVEGQASVGVTQNAGTSDPTKLDLYQHEALFRWDGWSLSSPRPGKALSTEPRPDGNPHDDTVPGGSQPGANAPASTIPLSVTSSAMPGSLPPLRYGHAYRIRARVVDIAGNSLPNPSATGGSPTDNTHATATRTFTRFEPVISPTLIQTAPITNPGESLERLVVRSDAGQRIEASSARHLAPPKTSELQAERHGTWDRSDGTPDPGLYGTIAAYDQGSLADGGIADPGDTNTPARRYYGASFVNVPYLPDPMAAGVNFSFVGGAPGGGPASTVVNYRTQAYPQRTTFQLFLTDGTAAPRLSTDANGNPYAFVVSLPPATVSQVQISSVVTSDDLQQHFGIWRWLLDTSRNSSALATTGAAGQLWAVTPYRTITLVHAVRTPLVAPRFGTPYYDRSFGSRASTLFDGGAIPQIPPNTQTTGTVPAKLFALGIGALHVAPSWVEVADDVTTSGPTRTTVTGAPFVWASGSDTRKVFTGAEEWIDTRHRAVTLTLTATSAFTDYYTETRTALALDPSAAPTTLDSRGVEPGSDRVVLTGTQTDLVRATTDTTGTVTNADVADYTVNYAAGTIQALRAAKTVDVTYLPPVSTVSTAPAASGESVTAAQQQPTISLPSSAPPSPPDVAYVIPVHRVNPLGTQGSATTASRIGGGLRVYLRRPWYSSGDGEQLGVVLASVPDNPQAPYQYSSAPAVPAALTDLVTRIGADPAFGLGNAPDYPVLSYFPGATATAISTSLLETTVSPVDVAAHDVFYDSTRGLWYCDITVRAPVFLFGERYSSADLGGYRPFLRLALVRYQAASVVGATVSNVRLASFVQLDPDRSATVTTGTNSSGRYASISIAGQQGYCDIFVDVQIRNRNLPDAAVNYDAYSSGATMLTYSNGAWSGQVPVPAAGTGRLVITERERTQYGQTYLRTVYTEVIPL